MMLAQALTCRQEDARHRALAEPQLLDHVVKVSCKGDESVYAGVRTRGRGEEGRWEAGLTHAKEERAGEDSGGRPCARHQHG